MRVDSCRKCGKDLEVYKKCCICNKPNKFSCHRCGYATTEQIHFQCMSIDLSYKLLESPTKIIR